MEDERDGAEPTGRWPCLTIFSGAVRCDHCQLVWRALGGIAWGKGFTIAGISPVPIRSVSAGIAINLSPPPGPSRHWCATPLPFTPRDLRRQRVQFRLPETPALTDPLVHRLKSRGIHRIEAPCRLGPNPCKAAPPQHLEVLRHCRLRDPELGPYRLHHFARSHFPMTQQFEDATAHRIRQDADSTTQVPL